MERLNNHAGEEMNQRGKKGAILARTRETARLLSQFAATPSARAEICLDYLNDNINDYGADPFRRILQSLPADERYYWIGTLYTLLLPTKMRRSQATYFTPPTIADALIDLAIDAGFDLANHRVLDPAAGGAAFLSTLAGRMANAGVSAEEIACRLNGIEIDTGLAILSERILAACLGVPLSRKVMLTGDALRLVIPTTYDLVIANPPYGRIGLNEVGSSDWLKVSHSGHINKYALFTELCIRLTKPGGIVALILPSSFRAGPLYDRMRSFIRSQAEILAIGSISGRDGVFIDVAQDISVLIARKGRVHNSKSYVRFPVLGSMPSCVPVVEQRLPQASGEAWSLPAADPNQVGGSTIADYGVTLRAGYFVWNREKSRLVSKLKSKQRGFPLVWAKNVRSGQLCRPAGQKNAGTDFVTFENESTAILKGPTAIMQRTTNDKQPRRLVSAVVDPAVQERWGGLVSENHTIALMADDDDRLELAVRLLNTAAVDERYRRVSGTAAVSVKLLRQLDLPSPQAFVDALAATDNAETAAVLAYRKQHELLDA